MTRPSYKVGDPLFVSSGGHYPEVTEYRVTRITPGGQVVATKGAGEIRVNSRGAITDRDIWSHRRVVDAERAAEITAEMDERKKWNAVRRAAEAIEKAARDKERGGLAVALAALTKAIADIEIGAAQ